MKKLIRAAALMILLAIAVTAFEGIAFAQTRVWVVTTGKCNIRSGPSKSNKTYRVAKKGEYFAYDHSEYDSRGVEWYGIVYGALDTAWISSKNAYVTSKDPDDPTPTKKPKPKPTPKPTLKPINYNSFDKVDYYVEVIGNGVNMRNEPADDRSIITSYSKGKILYATRTNGKWTQVMDESNNNIGYMYNKYLVVVEEPEEMTSELAEAFTPEPLPVEEADVQEGTVESFEDLQTEAMNAVLVDAPEGARNVTYRWNKDMMEAEISFEYEGVAYTLYETAGRSQTFGGDFGDASEPVETGCNLTMNASDTFAQAYGYSTQNATSYALFGPSAAKGALVLEVAKTVFPQDCI